MICNRKVSVDLKIIKLVTISKYVKNKTILKSKLSYFRFNLYLIKFEIL